MPVDSVAHEEKSETCHEVLALGGAKAFSRVGLVTAAVRDLRGHGDGTVGGRDLDLREYRAFGIQFYEIRMFTLAARGGRDRKVRTVLAGELKPFTTWVYNAGLQTGQHFRVACTHDNGKRIHVVAITVERLVVCAGPPDQRASNAKTQAARRGDAMRCDARRNVSKGEPLTVVTLASCCTPFADVVNLTFVTFVVWVFWYVHVPMRLTAEVLRRRRMRRCQSTRGNH